MKPRLAPWCFAAATARGSGSNHHKCGTRDESPRLTGSAPVLGDRAWRSAGQQASAGQRLVELFLALADAGLHAAGQEGVPRLERVHQRGRGQPHTAAAQVLKDEPLEGYAVRLSTPTCLRSVG